MVSGPLLTFTSHLQPLEWDPARQILCARPQGQIAVAVTTNQNVPPDSKPKPTPAFALSPAWDFLGLIILQNPAEAYLLLEGPFLLILTLSSFPLTKHFLSSLSIIQSAPCSLSCSLSLWNILPYERKGRSELCWFNENSGGGRSARECSVEVLD